MNGEDRYRRLAPGVRALPEAVPFLERVGAVVFDVDGVLLDTSDSYPRVISEVTQYVLVHDHGWRETGRLIEPAETALFKAAGGFNSDWALTRGAVLFYLWKALKLEMAAGEAGGAGAAAGARQGGTAALRRAAPSLEELTEGLAAAGGGLGAEWRWLGERSEPQLLRELEARFDGERVDRLCGEFYAGDRCMEMFGYPAREWRGPGLCERERPRLEARLLPARLRYGLYTGRVAGGETRLALERAGLVGRMTPGAVITGDRWRKPDPAGLRAAAAALDVEVAIFAGDNIDDAWTVRNYREVSGDGETVFLFAGVLGGAPGDRAEALFREAGADLIVDEPDALLRLLDGSVPRGSG
ncbi:MAG: haloacid dehalogenase [Bacillota bacterium]|nr:haloacid dehalogenase [Bacillota bacterium]